MEIKIEKNIPVPKGMASEIMEMAGKMEKGDSFFLGSLDKKKAYGLRSQLSRANKGVFAIRKVDGGYRCWKVN